MIKFSNRNAKIVEMGGKYYVEIKNKVFETGRDTPLVDDCEVKEFAQAEDAEVFLSEQFP